jgi:CubicO group peptidase (beta-lactamase class C family)
MRIRDTQKGGWAPEARIANDSFKDIKAMKKIFPFFLIVLLPGVFTSAQNRKICFQDKIPAWMAENNVPCVGIGIIENCQLKSVRVLGELQKNVPAPENTIFNIASQTKTVVAMLVLKLVEAGQWNLDEPLCKYWVDPDVSNDPFHKKLTTRHVLSHQTGFVNWRIDHPTKRLAFDFEPGTKYQYSGEGFEYLRKALENKFDRPLDKLLDSFVFIPLGMKDTGYWSKTLDTSRFALWHDAGGKKYETSYQTGVSAADDLLSTVEDYSKFCLDVIRGGGLSAALFSDMINPQVKVKEHYARGLGWGVVTDLPNGEYALEHGGSDIGVRTMAVLLPKSGRGVVVMTNGDNGMNVYNKIIEESIDIGETILSSIYQSAVAHAMITLSSKVIDEYVGTYIQPNGRVMIISREGKAIRTSGDGIPTLRLYPESENKFFLKDIDAEIEFIRNEARVVIKLITYENGKKGMEAQKSK